MSYKLFESDMFKTCHRQSFIIYIQQRNGMSVMHINNNIVFSVKLNTFRFPTACLDLKHTTTALYCMLQSYIVGICIRRSKNIRLFVIFLLKDR